MKGIPNFRAVGGLPIANEPNKSFRSGFLFRCAEPTKATPEDLEKIRSLGINRIYDLRSIPEIKKHQIANIGNETSGEPYSWEGVERVYAPVFPEESWDPVSMAIRHKEYQREDAEVSSYTRDKRWEYYLTPLGDDECIQDSCLARREGIWIDRARDARSPTAR